MAMTMTGEVQLPAPRQTVWEKLNDTETLKATIPGCEVAGEDLRHLVRGRRRDQDRARESALEGQGDADRPRSAERLQDRRRRGGRSRGFAKGSADVRLSDKDGGTLLTYNVDAQIGGKLAQLGQRLINGAPRRWRTISSRNSPRRSGRVDCARVQRV